MERSSKRKATEQLDSDKFKREEAEEEEEEQPQTIGGTWQRASEDVLQRRKVVKAKRKGATQQKADSPPKEAEPAKSSIADKLPTFWTPSSDTFSWPSTGPKEAEKKEEPSAGSSDFKWSFSTAPAPETKEPEKPASGSSDFKWSFSPTSAAPTFSLPKLDYVPPATTSSVAKWPSFSISDNFTFGTSSNWPSFSTPTKDSQPKEDAESGPESGANTPNTLSPPEKEKPTLPPLEAVKTGEEEETTVAEARVRLYEFVKEEKAAWKERCTGTLKINVDRSNKYRIVMRTDNALRVILNALPFAGMKIEKPNPQQIKFTCMNAVTQTVKLANLWIKIPSVEDTEKLYAALEKCKNSKADK